MDGRAALCPAHLMLCWQNLPGRTWANTLRRPLWRDVGGGDESVRVLSFILRTGASNPHTNSGDSIIIPVYPTLRFLFFPLNHTLSFKCINMRPAFPLCTEDELISRPAALPNFHFVQTVLFYHLPSHAHLHFLDRPISSLPAPRHLSLPLFPRYTLHFPSPANTP